MELKNASLEDMETPSSIPVEDEYTDNFRRDLKRLLNRNSMENASNTPDFILANYLLACLLAFDTAVQQREIWHRYYGTDT